MQQRRAAAAAARQRSQLAHAGLAGAGGVACMDGWVGGWVGVAQLLSSLSLPLGLLLPGAYASVPRCHKVTHDQLLPTIGGAVCGTILQLLSDHVEEAACGQQARVQLTTVCGGGRGGWECVRACRWRVIQRRPGWQASAHAASGMWVGVGARVHRGGPGEQSVSR